MLMGRGVVPKDHRAEYEAYARALGPIMLEYGADEVVDAWGNDVPEGKLTSFPRAVLREPGELAVFSWIVWPDRATRDRGWGLAERDPRFAVMTLMPFDGKRMIFGGFDMIHHTRKGDEHG